MTPTSRAGISRADGAPVHLRRSCAVHRSRSRARVPTAGARCSAFTLIEVIAALAIVSTALLGLLHLHLVSIRMSDTAQTMAMAVLLAQEKIAETVCGGPVPAGTKSGTAEVNRSRFTWRTEVTNVDSLVPYGLGRSSLQQLRVDVVWREGSGARSVQMTTYVADNRLHEKQKQ